MREISKYSIENQNELMCNDILEDEKEVNIIVKHKGSVNIKLKSLKLNTNIDYNIKYIRNNNSVRRKTMIVKKDKRLV